MGEITDFFEFVDVDQKNRGLLPVVRSDAHG